MLELPILDDELFTDIVARAIGRIPSLCADWTDFNAHDPGMTLVELFAWYKEMQQYHLDQITRQDLLTLLRLLGIYPRRIRATRAQLLVKGCETPRAYYPSQPVFSAVGVPFELEGRMDNVGRGLQRAYLQRDGMRTDVTELLTGERLALPLREGESLLLGLRGVEQERELRLWLWVREDYPVPRNPFGQDTAEPREIIYEWLENGRVHPLAVTHDETHGLCLSGGLRLLSETPLIADRKSENAPPLVWLQVRIAREGCEELPALRGVSVGYAMVVQRQTLVECHAFTVAPDAAEVEICSWLACDTTPTVLARQASGGWRMVSPQQVSVTPTQRNGLLAKRISVTAPMINADEQNLRVIYRAERALQASSTGLPGQRIPLLESGKQVALDTLRVMCREGELYYDWRYVDSLLEARGSDRVYTLDGENTLLFGDNRNGAVPEVGALYIAGLAATLGAGGQISEGQAFYMAGEDENACGVAAGVCPGRDWEAAEAAAERLYNIWEERARTVTAADYERAALRTPGRRVAVAKALPHYEPGQQFRSRVTQTLTVVVAPFAECERPLPDESFLKSVCAQLENCRVICTRVIVTAPLYLPLRIQAEIVRGDEADGSLYDLAWECLSALFGKEREIGGIVRCGDIIVALGSLAQIAGVREVVLHAPQCRHNDQGELVLPDHAQPWLESLELRETQQS